MGHADEQFDYRTYPKAGWVLHMLWTELGEKAFRKCVRTYLERHALDYVVTEDFRFYRQILAGAEKQQPRWKRVQNSMNWRLGETVGQIYVAEAFPPEAKARALDMIEHIRAAIPSESGIVTSWREEVTLRGKQEPVVACSLGTE